MTEAVREDNAVDLGLERYGRLDTGSDPAFWLASRESAIARFREVGFPTTRNEDWKHTSVAPLLRASFVDAESLAPVSPEPEELEKFTYFETSSARLVFVDGRFDGELSSLRDLPAGVKVTTLAHALREDAGSIEAALGSAPDEPDGFRCLNAALATEGAVVIVPAGCRVEAPIHLLFLGTARPEPFSAHIRNFILAGENSEMTVVERYAGMTPEASYFNNVVTTLDAGDGARVEHYKIQRESDEAYHLAAMDIRQGRGSSVTSTSMAIGSLLGRTAISVRSTGPGATSVLNGLYVAEGKQHLDNQLEVHHSTDHCSSDQFYKGILEDRATAVFNGKIVVDEATMGTDAHQTNKNLLLSDEARVDTRPQLEIYADDVKCSHGATIGQLDPQALFYLRARGIAKKQAESILTYAFASDVIDRVKIEPLRQRIREYLASRTRWGRITEETR